MLINCIVYFVLFRVFFIMFFGELMNVYIVLFVDIFGFMLRREYFFIEVIVCVIVLIIFLFFFLEKFGIYFMILFMVEIVSFW